VPSSGSKTRMPIPDKIFWFAILLLLGVMICKANDRTCAPWACDLCSFVSSEYKSLKDKIPDELPTL